jgi:hypothetical protein
MQPKSILWAIVWAIVGLGLWMLGISLVVRICSYIYNL